ncbi:MAG: hypothetical protein WAS94_02765 [Candidatus Saccharimonadales bacterium]
MRVESDGSVTLCHVDQNCCWTLGYKDGVVRVSDEHGNTILGTPAEFGSFLAEAAGAANHLGIPEVATAASS